MNLWEIKLDNFLSHKDTTLRLPDGFIGIVGLNGSGKSSLVGDAVTWALWGRSRVGGAGDDLIYWNADYCQVRVRFKVNGIDYQVRRHRTRSKRTCLTLERITLTVVEPYVDLSRATLKDTQEEVNRILGMTYEVFKNSCCIEQGGAGSFSNLSPREAGKLILEILQLDKYGQYKTAAVDKCMTVRIEKDKLEAANENLQEHLDTVTGIGKVKSEKAVELRSLKKNCEVLRGKFKKSEVQGDIIKAKWQKLVLKIKENSTKLSSVEKSISKVSKRIDLISKVNGKCPLCSTALGSKKKEQVTNDLVGEHEALLDEKSGIETKLKNDRSHIPQLTGELKKYDITRKREEVASLNMKIAAVEAEVVLLSQQSNDVRVTRTKIKSNQEKIDVLDTDETIYSELGEAFGPKGIPLLVVDNAFKELEVLVNNNMQLLSDLPIEVELKTQRESVTGELIDTIQILINEGTNSRPYFNYSGGEKMIIDLSLRLGLSELLARRNNFKVETLIIDEGLGSLDESNQLNLVRTLEKLTGKFKKIITITHTQAKEYFRNYVELRKHNGISKVVLFGDLWYNKDREKISARAEPDHVTLGVKPKRRRVRKT